MGHGHHWGAVLNNVRQDLGRALELGIAGGEVIGKRRFPNWHGPQGVGSADITLIQNSKAGFGTLGIIVSDDLSSQTYVHSAFPIGSPGHAHVVQILDVSESSFGLEACIVASIGDAKITFFEPHYSLDADLYSTGAQVNVALSGIAYDVHIPDPKETVIHPDIGEVHLRGAAIFLPIDGSGGTMPAMNGFGLAYMLAPGEGPGPDDYRFRGVIQEVESIEFLQLPAWRFTITALRLDDGNTDLDIDIYVLDENIFGGQTPKVGDDLAGTLWLQGVIAESDSKLSLH
jgi:hypothetical protein